MSADLKYVMISLKGWEFKYSPIQISTIRLVDESKISPRIKPSMSLLELTLMFFRHTQGQVSERELATCFDKFQAKRLLLKHFKPSEFSSAPPSPSNVCKPKPRATDNFSRILANLRSFDPLLSEISDSSTEESSDDDAPSF